MRSHSSFLLCDHAWDCSAQAFPEQGQQSSYTEGRVCNIADITIASQGEQQGKDAIGSCWLTPPVPAGAPATGTAVMGVSVPAPMTEPWGACPPAPAPAQALRHGHKFACIAVLHAQMFMLNQLAVQNEILLICWACACLLQRELGIRMYTISHQAGINDAAQDRRVGMYLLWRLHQFPEGCFRGTACLWALHARHSQSRHHL